VHHWGVKALLQGVWPIPLLLVLHVPLWIGLMLSLAIMLDFKDWRKHPRNIVDYVCDSVLQIAIPVIFANPWMIIVIYPIYWATYPYATP
jgi:hypothetical protein